MATPAGVSFSRNIWDIKCPAVSNQGVENKEEISVLSNRSNRAFSHGSSASAAMAGRSFQTAAISDLLIGESVVYTLLRFAASRPGCLKRQDRSVRDPCRSVHRNRYPSLLGLSGWFPIRPAQRSRLASDCSDPEFGQGRRADGTDKSHVTVAVTAVAHRLTGKTRLPARCPEEQRSSREQEGAPWTPSIRPLFSARMVGSRNGVPLLRHSNHGATLISVARHHKRAVMSQEIHGGILSRQLGSSYEQLFRAGSGMCDL